MQFTLKIFWQERFVDQGVPINVSLQFADQLQAFSCTVEFGAVEIANPDVLNADKTEIVVPPGEARDLSFVAKTAGRYRLICSDHDWAGMAGRITIK